MNYSLYIDSIYHGIFKNISDLICYKSGYGDYHDFDIFPVV